MLCSGEWCAARKNLLPTSLSFAADTRSDSLDLLHTEITLNLLNAPQISAQCNIQWTPRVAEVSEIRLDLQGFTIDSVSVNGSPASFTKTADLLTIDCPTPVASGDTAWLSITYHGQPAADASGWGGFYNQSGYTFNLGVGFAADPHSFGRAWFPCFDNFVERSTFEVSIISQANRPGFSNGVLVEEAQQSGQVRRRWRIEQPIPSYLACFAAGPYTTWRREYDAIPVEIAAAPADTGKVAATFKNLPDALACMKHWFGPYLWPKIGYSLVPFNSGAMEHATNVAIGRSFIDGSLNFESLWVHELSHHWWGDLATCSTAEDMWLNEGWAVYSEHLFAEWMYGQDKFREEVRTNFLNVLENSHVAEGGYRAVSGVPHALTYGQHVYNKGPVVAHNLRGYLGDSLFREGVRSALTLTQFADWSSADLRDKMNAATGQDLTDFFEDWVFSGGFPHFSVDSFRIEVPVIDTYFVCRIFVKQKLRGAPHFHQNVPLEFTFVDENWQRQTRAATVSGEHSEVVFHFPLPHPVPKFVWINTEQKLLFARAEKELVVKTGGSKNFAPAKMNMNISALPDSALIRVEHHYAMPDTGGLSNPNNYVLSNRYWSIEADLPQGFVGSASIFYDGRGQLDQLDTELFAQTSPSEDSILLLFRPMVGMPWTEYPTYLLNKINSSNDKYGFIRIDNVQPGQYTIGKGVSTVATKTPTQSSVQLKAFPNPASNTIRLKASESFDKVLVFNEKGQAMRETSITPTNETELMVTGYPTGRYWFVVFTKRGAVSCSAVIVP